MNRVYIRSMLWSCLLIGCSRYGLWVDHYPVTPQSLPSTFVHSPDPLQDIGYQGEVLWVVYDLPVEKWRENPQLTIAFLWENLEEEVQEIFLETPSGRRQFSWLNEEFLKKGFLLGYRVHAGSYVQESPLFRKLIRIDGKCVGTKVPPLSQSQYKGQ